MLDRTPGNDAPDALERRMGGRDALPAALTRCARELAPLLAGDDTPGSERAVLRRYVLAIRAAGVPPERAIAAFKFMLTAQPEINRLGRSEHVGRVASLARIVIEEYFDAAVNAPDGP